MATTTNYSWTTPDNTAYVKDGASAIRTLGSSVDTTLFSVSGGKNVGMVHLNTTTFTTAASVSVDNVFTSSYQNYFIVFNATGTVDSAAVSIQYRASATTTTTNYAWTNNNNGANSAPAGNYSGASFTNTMIIGNFGSSGAHFGFEANVFNPQNNSNTVQQASAIRSSSTVGGIYYYDSSGTQVSTTQFDGFIISTGSGNMTGSVRIYGLRNS
jgi:hypothetical protein